MDNLNTPCGRSRNRKGKLFTTHGINHHMQNCEDCNRIAGRIEQDEDEKDPPPGSVFDLLDMSDEPDGVYFALRDELENW